MLREENHQMIYDKTLCDGPFRFIKILDTSNVKNVTMEVVYKWKMI